VPALGWAVTAIPAGERARGKMGAGPVGIVDARVTHGSSTTVKPVPEKVSEKSVLLMLIGEAGGVLKLASVLMLMGEDGRVIPCRIPSERGAGMFKEWNVNEMQVEVVTVGISSMPQVYSARFVCETCE